MNNELSEVIEAISKSPSSRSQTDLKLIHETIKRLKFFKSMWDEFTEDTIRSCCRLIKYEYKPANSYVIHYGEKASRFYIILRGKVSVLVPQQSLGKLKMLEVHRMEDGQSFGELSLNENKGRSATILCKEVTHLLYLEKDQYLDLFVHHMQSKQRKIINTLRQNYMFSSFSNMFLIRFSYLLSEQRVSRYNYVFRENSKVERIFIVKEGEFRLTKQIQKHPKHKSSVRLNKAKKEAAEIAILSNGSFCNEEDLLHENHKFSCVCVSNHGILFSVKKSDFVQNVLGKDTEYSMKNVRQKQMLRDSQTKSVLNTRKQFENTEKTRVTPITIEKANKKPLLKICRSARLNNRSYDAWKKNDSYINRSRNSKSRNLLKMYKNNDEEVTLSIKNTHYTNRYSKQVYNWQILDNYNGLAKLMATSPVQNYKF